MLLTLNEMMELLCLIAEVQRMTATLERSGYGTAMAGAGALAGGLMGGLLGFAIGGALGGVLGASMFRKKFGPVRQIIMELPSGMQQLLYHKVYILIRHLDWTDMESITALVMTDRNIQIQLVGVLANFLTKEMGAQIWFGK